MTTLRIVTGVSAFLFVFTMLHVTMGAPASPGGEEETFFDQRQNGSQNYRVNLDGLVVVHVPSNALAAFASSVSDDSFEQQLFQLLSSAGAPAGNSPVEPEQPGEGPSSPGAPATNTKRPQLSGEQQVTRKPVKKNGQRLRFANILPFLRQA